MTEFSMVRHFVVTHDPQLHIMEDTSEVLSFITPKGTTIKLTPVDEDHTKWAVYSNPLCKWYHKTMGKKTDNAGLLKGLPSLISAF